MSTNMNTNVYQKLTDETIVRQAEQLSRNNEATYYSDRVKDLVSLHIIPPFHFPHISQQDSGLIAFYRTLDNFIQDRSTRIKAGKYLALVGRLMKDEGWLAPTDVSVRDKAEVYNFCNTVEIGYASTEEEICDVYYNSLIKSCMSNIDLYELPYTDQVIRVYASPDIKVAWLKSNGKIVARSVINLVNSSYLNVYSHSGYSRALREKLEEDGYYKDDCGLEGCRILKIEGSYTGYKLPYLDGDEFNVFESSTNYEYLLVGEGVIDGHSYSEEICNERTLTGYTECLEVCSCCEERTGVIGYVDTSEYSGGVCQHCLESEFNIGIINSAGDTGYMLTSNSIEVSDGKYYEESIIEEFCEYSYRDTTWIIKEDAYYSTILDDWFDYKQRSVTIANLDDGSEEDRLPFGELDSDNIVVKDSEIFYTSRPKYYEEEEGYIPIYEWTDTKDFILFVNEAINEADPTLLDSNLYCYTRVIYDVFGIDKCILSCDAVELMCSAIKEHKKVRLD